MVVSQTTEGKIDIHLEEEDYEIFKYYGTYLKVVYGIPIKDLTDEDLMKVGLDVFLKTNNGILH